MLETLSHLRLRAETIIDELPNCLSDDLDGRTIEMGGTEVL
jgi:hypothetical protein